MKELTERHVEELNNQLVSLNLAFDVNISLDDLRNSSSQSLLFITYDILNELEVNLENDCHSLEQIYNQLTNTVYAPPFSLQSDWIWYKLLSFLATELQASRLSPYQETIPPSTDIIMTDIQLSPSTPIPYNSNHTRGMLAFILQKMCKSLDININEDVSFDENDVLDKIINHISNLQNPSMMMINTTKDSSKLLQHIQLQDIQPNQMDFIHRLEDTFHQDFTMRREMLLKRLHVTIKSFLWSEWIESRQMEMNQIIQSQMSLLTISSQKYQLIDALHASSQLLYELSRKVSMPSHGSSSKRRGKSIVKQILIGKVPDRGGRTDEVRPKNSNKDDYSVKKRKHGKH